MDRDFLPAYKQDQTFFLSGVAQKVEKAKNGKDIL